MVSRAAKKFSDLVHHCPKGRFDGIQRNYGIPEVLRLRGSYQIDYTVATLTANKLWEMIKTDPYIPSLGALTGNQAMQMVRAGLKAIYLSGWQVAGDANSVGEMYPDQSLYPPNSGPDLCRRFVKCLRRADQIESVDHGYATRDWLVPIVADCEAGFGGALNCYEIARAYIEAGAAGIHFEDQLGSEKKCGHMGGKVLIPTRTHIRHLNAARLAADVCGVGTIIISRTDAEAAKLITSDVDDRDREFIDFKAGRTEEGFFRLKDGTGVDHSIMRSLNFAPYADLVWMETATPDLDEAKEFAEAIKKVYPNKKMAYNCSPSFNWRSKLSPEQCRTFQKELGAMGYAFQFVTLAGFHLNNFGTYSLSAEYQYRGMEAYTELQQEEFSWEKKGYTAVKHQREVGTGYYDAVANAVSGGQSSTTALAGSTEDEQFMHDEGEEPVKMLMPNVPGDEALLTDDALLFIRELHDRFNHRRLELLAARKDRQVRISSGVDVPGFDPATKDIRDGDWRIESIPEDMKDRRVEITGPVDRKMVINALNSGAKVFMADFEDSNTPTWRNQLSGQKNLYDAIRGVIQYKDPNTGKQYTLIDTPAVLHVRPRGWHLPEKHVLVHGEPISGSLFDFGIYMYHNARKLLDNGTGPYFYLPKLENWREAELWNDVFNFAQDRLQVPRGSIKCTVLIEHLLAMFQEHEILHALKDHITGLNCGRWDYIFSYIKVFRDFPAYVLPDRAQIKMTTPFMHAYSHLTIKTCHRRGVHAMGGMAAQIPIKNNPEENDIALAAVTADKQREVADGHDGTWVAHPGLVPLAMDIFDNLMPQPNQVDQNHLSDYNVTAEELTEIPKGTRTEKGLRHNINVTIGYMESWLRGTGCVPLYNLMEDAATAEISRAQLWQWLRHEAKLDDGRVIDEHLIRRVVYEETQKWLQELGPAHNRVRGAASLLQGLVLSERMPEFLTLAAYDKILTESK